MRITNFFATFLFVLCVQIGQTQDFIRSYDELTDEWLLISSALKDYEGLSEFCLSPEVRNSARNVLAQIHHYDSLTLDYLRKPGVEVEIGHHEYKKAIKDISRLEEDYDFPSFIAFLKESCITRNDLESNKSELASQSGMDSYDGQKYILETDLSKYLRHIDKRVVMIDQHIHRIHPELKTN